MASENSEITKKKRFKLLRDGIGVAIKSNEKFLFACCDCGLVHNMVLVSQDGKTLGFAVKRNQKETKQRRKLKKIAVSIRNLAR